MASYQDILKQIESLQGKAEEQRRKELKKVIDEINGQIAEFGLQPADLKFPKTGGGRSRNSSKRGTVKPKYRNPETGETWTGRGRAPRWLAEAEKRGGSRDQFLIK